MNGVRLCVLLVLVGCAALVGAVVGLLFGPIFGLFGFLSFGTSIGILYPFFSTFIENIVHPRELRPSPLIQ